MATFKLENKTRWSTEDLRQFIAVGLAVYEWGQPLKVVVSSARTQVSAYVQRKSSLVQFRVPEPKAVNLGKMPSTNSLLLARLLWWAQGVMRGFSKRDLRRWHEQPVLWAHGLEIGVDPEAAKPDTSRIERLEKLKSKRSIAARKTLERIKARIKNLEKGLKRAKKALTKARQRVKYYDKQNLECDLAHRIKQKLGAKDGK
jgi:hypothetical protein